jgi:hypothetical protein
MDKHHREGNVLIYLVLVSYSCGFDWWCHLNCYVRFRNLCYWGFKKEKNKPSCKKN